MKNFRKHTALFLALTIMFLSCSEQEIDPGTAPDMPESSTMEMDFSNFQENSGGRLAEAYNWGTAVTAVGIWNTVLTVTLALPVASFKAAASKTPTFDHDRNVWVWSFDHNVLGRTYSFELLGKKVDGSIEWQMYASEENGFQNALWYTGTSALDGSEGQWILNKNGNNPSEFLQIDWSKESDEIAGIKYTNIEDPANPYIEYGKSDNADFNRYYNVVGSDNSLRIEWNKENGNGRLKIGDESYQCWDTAFQDIEC